MDEDISTDILSVASKDISLRQDNTSSEEFILPDPSSVILNERIIDCSAIGLETDIQQYDTNNIFTSADGNNILSLQGSPQLVSSTTSKLEIKFGNRINELHNLLFEKAKDRNRKQTYPYHNIFTSHQFLFHENLKLHSLFSHFKNIVNSLQVCRIIKLYFCIYSFIYLFILYIYIFCRLKYRIVILNLLS